MNNLSDSNRKWCTICHMLVNVVERAGPSLAQIRWLTCSYCEKTCHLKCLISHYCRPSDSAEVKQKLEREFSEEVYICRMCRMESANGLVRRLIFYTYNQSLNFYCVIAELCLRRRHIKTEFLLAKKNLNMRASCDAGLCTCCLTI